MIEISEIGHGHKNVMSVIEIQKHEEYTVRISLEDGTITDIQFPWEVLTHFLHEILQTIE